MRKIIGKAEIGESAMFYFYKEDGYCYPTINLNANNGESASIDLQHMSSIGLHKLADEIKRVANLRKD